MKRLTKKDFNICDVCARGPLGMDWDCDGSPACGEKVAYDRLAAIEDILGDEYDLDRLRELAQADRGEIQAADVAPVRHGRWIPSDQTGDCCYACSECGFERDAYLLDIGNYCPNCGARMDKEDNT